MGLTGDLSQLDGMIARFDPRALETDLRDAIRDEVARVAREQWASGRGPSGQVWPVNTSNSRFPSLERPTSQIVFRSYDGGIAASGDDVLRYHHPRSSLYAHLDRQVFPDDGLSQAWFDAADLAAERLFRERFGKR